MWHATEVGVCKQQPFPLFVFVEGEEKQERVPAVTDLC